MVSRPLQSLAVIAATLAAAALPASAQSTQPSTPAAPLLQQLSNETQAVHAHVTASIVRLRMPQQRLTIETAPAEELLQKWEQRLEPAVRQKLIEHLASARASRQNDVNLADALNQQSPERMFTGVMVFRMPTGGDVPVQLPMNLVAVPRNRMVGPGVLGVVMNDRHSVLVAGYLDRAAVGDRPIRVERADGDLADATLVGSDRQTGLTLLRLAQPAEAAVNFAPQRPAQGSLVLIYNTQSDAAKLAIWTGGTREAGMIVTPDGQFAGFAGQGNFVSAPAAAQIVQAMAQQGTVRRAVLGVRISEVSADDPARQWPTLDEQPAIRIDRVLEGSAAAQGGLLPGDVILSMANQPMGDLATFAGAIATQSGPTVFQILRAGTPLSVTIDLRR